MRSAVKAALVAAAVGLMAFGTPAFAQREKLSPEQEAAKKNFQVNRAYEEAIKNTAPIRPETPNNDPWNNMRTPSSTASTATTSGKR
jgi:hypothetical protein